MAFAIEGDLSSASIISLKIEITFAADSDYILLLITEVLLCAAAGELARLKKQRYWTPCNAVLLCPFLTETTILHRESDASEHLNMFACSITKWEKKWENASEADDENDKDSVITIEGEDKKTSKSGKEKQATVEMLTTIVDNCNNVLAFLQAVIVKSTRVTVPLSSLRTDKRVRLVPSLDRR